MIFNCSVNELTGLLVITNISNTEIKNIKIGETFLTFYLDKGLKYDYWYSMPLYGKITGEGIEVVLAADAIEDEENEQIIILFKDDVNCYFSLGCEYQLDIKEVNGEVRLYVLPGYKPGSSTQSTQNHFPAD